MKDYLGNFLSTKLGIYATIILIFTYNVLLAKDVDCTCKKQNTECNLYMAMPFFIIFILILWMDKTFQRIWIYLCCCPCSKSTECCCSSLFWVLVRHMIKAALVGLLWVTSVLIDGDWYVCCQNDHSEQQAQLACKDKHKLTAEECTIIAELKNYSKIIGFSSLLCIIFVAALMSFFKWRKCCEQSSCDRRVLYDKLILEEEKNVLKEILREAAKERLTKDVKEKIGQEIWTKCFDVAEELIKNSTQPRLSQQDSTTTTTTTPTTMRPTTTTSIEQGTLTDLTDQNPMVQ